MSAVLPMALRPMLFVLFLLFAGCGGGTETSPPAPAAIRLEAASVGTDGAGNDAVTVTATVTDAAGQPVSGRVEVRANAGTITGTSDENGQLSVPVTIDSFMPTTIIAAAGTVTSNTISVSRSGETSASALVAVIPSADGRYAINCYGFNGVAGFEVDISYDPAAASGPVIEKGSFVQGVAMVSYVDAVAGVLRLACIKPYPSSLSGAGTLATFYFDRETATPPGTISSLQVQVVDVSGAPIPARTMLITS